jgi:hypothetical protein
MADHRQRHVRAKRLAAAAGLLAAALAALFTALTLGSDDAALAESPPATKHRASGGAHAKADTATSISVEWVGDIALATRYGAPATPPPELFAGVHNQLERADLTIGNLEGTLGEGGAAKCAIGAVNCFSFQAPPAYAEAFRDAGFDVMNLANNHAYDYGAEGQRQTIDALKSAGLRRAGLPGEVTHVRVDGVRVAIVGFAPYGWASRLEDLAGAHELVATAAGDSDVVIVLMHAGAEGTAAAHTPTGTEYAFGESRGPTRDFAHTVIDAGADLVLGSGPHVVRGLERYRGRVIAYSLGDFLGYHTFGLGGALSESAILRVRLDGGGRINSGRWIPVTLTGPGLPQLDPAGTSTSTVRELSAADFPDSAVELDAVGRFRSR